MKLSKMKFKWNLLSFGFSLFDVRMITFGSNGCDRVVACVIFEIDDVLPASECDTIRISRQFEYVLKCGTNL